MLDSSLIFTDEYYLQLSDVVIENGNQMEIFLSRYLSILKEIRNTAILSGEVADKLTDFIYLVSQLEDNIDYCSNMLARQCKNLIHAVDSADSFLF